VKIDAHPVSVQVATQLGNDKIIDKGFHINISSVTQFRILEIIPVQGILEFGDVFPDIVALLNGKLLIFGVYIRKGNIHTPRPSHKWGVPASFLIPVNADDISSGQFIAGIVIRFQGGDIHPVFIDLDFLHEQINSPVFPVDFYLHEPGPRMPTVAHGVAYAVCQRISHQGFVGVRAMKNPVIFGWQTKQGNIVV